MRYLSRLAVRVVSEQIIYKHEFHFEEYFSY